MCGNRMIRRIQSEDEHFALVRVMQRSFGIVAEQYGITEGNAPTNPAFVTIEKLKAYLAKQVDLFALFQEGEMIGAAVVASITIDSVELEENGQPIKLTTKKF